VGKFGIDEETAIWEMSLKRLMLLLREKVFIESEHPGIQLSTMEYIDSHG
jgi:hypothetical protein